MTIVKRSFYTIYSQPCLDYHSPVEGALFVASERCHSIPRFIIMDHLIKSFSVRLPTSEKFFHPALKWKRVLMAQYGAVDRGLSRTAGQ